MLVLEAELGATSVRCLNRLIAGAVVVRQGDPLGGPHSEEHLHLDYFNDADPANG